LVLAGYGAGRAVQAAARTATAGGAAAGSAVTNNVGGYLAKKAPQQVTPGTRILHGQYVNNLGQVQPWTAHYDQFGRVIARTDFNAGNVSAGIPAVHHHLFRWGRGQIAAPYGGHIPGVYTP